MIANKRILLALFVVGCVAAYVEAQIPGGLNHEKAPDDEIRRVLQSIHPDAERMASQRFESLEPIVYRKQVVAGANYFVKVLATAKDGTRSHMHLRIYKPFRGPLELSAIRTNQERHTPLDYFD